MTYTVTVANPTDQVYSGATFTDNLARVLDQAVLTGTPTATSGAVTTGVNTLTWTGNVPPNGQVTVTYQVTAD